MDPAFTPVTLVRKKSRIEKRLGQVTKFIQDRRNYIQSLEDVQDEILYGGKVTTALLNFGHYNDPSVSILLCAYTVRHMTTILDILERMEPIIRESSALVRCDLSTGLVSEHSPVYCANVQRTKEFIRLLWHRFSGWYCSRRVDFCYRSEDTRDFHIEFLRILCRVYLLFFFNSDAHEGYSRFMHSKHKIMLYIQEKFSSHNVPGDVEAVFSEERFDAEFTLGHFDRTMEIMINEDFMLSFRNSTFQDHSDIMNFLFYMFSRFTCRVEISQKSTKNFNDPVYVNEHRMQIYAKNTSDSGIQQQVDTMYTEQVFEVSETLSMQYETYFWYWLHVERIMRKGFQDNIQTLRLPWDRTSQNLYTGLVDYIEEILSVRLSTDTVYQCSPEDQRLIVQDLLVHMQHEKEQMTSVNLMRRECYKHLLHLDDKHRYTMFSKHELYDSAQTILTKTRRLDESRWSKELLDSKVTPESIFEKIRQNLSDSHLFILRDLLVSLVVHQRLRGKTLSSSNMILYRPQDSLDYLYQALTKHTRFECVNSIDFNGEMYPEKTHPFFIIQVYHRYFLVDRLSGARIQCVDIFSAVSLLGVVLFYYIHKVKHFGRDEQRIEELLEQVYQCLPSYFSQFRGEE